MLVAFSSDRGTIIAVYHIAPGTPDGGYPVTFTTHTGYPYEGFTAYVANGVGSPTLIVSQTRGTELSYEGVELVTTNGASASLTRRDVYFGELGEPYPGTLPEPEDKVAYLDIYINMPPPSPTPEPTPSDESHKPNDADDGGTGSDDGGRNENVTGGGDDCGNTHGMARYTVDLATASLRITDTPLEYTPPAGPRIDFVVTYGQRDSDQSPSQQYSNWGQIGHSIGYPVTDDPMNLTANVSVYVRVQHTLYQIDNTRNSTCLAQATLLCQHLHSYKRYRDF